MPRSSPIDATHATRRLAAIVVADVVGYTRLMEQDESGVHRRLKELRGALIDPKIAEHGGRVVKTAGDGMLLEFGSATAALRCAVDVQRAMAARNRDLAPETRIEFRIGINLGDVIVDDQDVAGDGVNVAARLETLAEPGGICIAAVVRDQVHDDLDAAFIDIGEQRVKNIARPIRVFRVGLDSEATGIRNAGHDGRARATRWLWPAAGAFLIGAAGVAGWLWWQSTTPSPVAVPVTSIAVMPFTVVGPVAGDAERADLLTRDVTAALARTRKQFVVASSGLAAAYKGKPIDARTVGRELNVRYLAEIELRRMGDSIVANMHLVDVASGSQVWTERVEFRAADDDAAFMRGLTTQLREALESEAQRQASATPWGKSANELVLRAFQMASYTDLKATHEAGKLVDEALQREPNYVPALTGRFFLLLYEADLDSRADFDQVRRSWDQLSERAVELDDKNPTAWLARSIAFTFKGRFDAGLEANAVARRLDPTNRNILNWRGFLQVFKGQPREALQVVAEAHAAFPENDAGELRVACLANLHMGEYEKAIALCEKSSGLEVYSLIPALLVAAYANAGETAKAAAAKDELLRLIPGFTIAMFKARRYSEEPAYVKNVETHVYSGWRKAGIPEQ